MYLFKCLFLVSPTKGIRIPQQQGPCLLFIALTVSRKYLGPWEVATNISWLARLWKSKLHRLDSLWKESSLSFDFQFSITQRGHFICGLFFKHFLMLLPNPQTRGNWHIFHLRTHHTPFQFDSERGSLTGFFAFILALAALFGAKSFPLVLTSCFPIGSHMKSLVCQCNNFLLIIKEETSSLRVLRKYPSDPKKPDFQFLGLSATLSCGQIHRFQSAPLFSLSGQSRHTDTQYREDVDGEQPEDLERK